MTTTSRTPSLTVFRISLLLAATCLATPGLATASPAATGCPPAPNASSEIWILPGRTLWDGPSADAEPVGRVGELALLPVSGCAGDRIETRYRGRQVWTDLDASPTRELTTARRDQPGVSSERIARLARKRLKIRKPSFQVGPFDVYTDVEDALYLERVADVLRLAEDNYSALYGLRPETGPETRQALIIFADQLDYAVFLKKLGHEKHAFSRSIGINEVILTRYADHVGHAAMLGQVLGHTARQLGRRIYQRPLHKWLEVGLQGQAESVWIEDETLESVWIKHGTPPRSFHEAALGLLVHFTREDGMPGLGALANLGKDAFYEHSGVPTLHATTLTRFLQSDEGYAPGFLDFLSDLSRKETRPDMPSLLSYLDTDIETLDRHFRVWVQTEYEAAQARREQEKQQRAQESSESSSPDSGFGP